MKTNWFQTCSFLVWKFESRKIDTPHDFLQIVEQCVPFFVTNDHLGNTACLLSKEQTLKILGRSYPAS